jgi:NTE family protein
MGTVAFALSGGGNLGAMQAGMMRALLENGVDPDLMVGSSIGALNAAFYATHPGVAGCSALESAWSNLRRRDVFRFDFARVLAGFVGLRDHLVTTRRLRDLIKLWLGIERIEEAQLPFAALAADALTGERVLMAQGDVATALLASSAIPGFFAPVRYGDRWLIDGSLSSSSPALESLELGADEVYVLSTTTAPRVRPPRGAVAMAMNSVSLVTARVQRDQLEMADRRARERGGAVWIVPSPGLDAPSPFDFRQGASLAAASYLSAREWIVARRDAIAPGS